MTGRLFVRFVSICIDLYLYVSTALLFSQVGNEYAMEEEVYILCHTVAYIMAQAIKTS